MVGNLKYQDHVRHYQADAAYNDYFSIDRFEEQAIRRRYEALLYEARPDSNARILEIGSGGSPLPSTWMNKTLLRYFPLDIAVINVQALKERFSGHLMHPTSGDIFRLPFKEKSFDIIVMSEVLEHVEAAATALQEVRRVLKPAGRLLISVPYKERIRYQICVHCNKPTPTHAHFHSFDEEKISALLKTAGFQAERYRFINNKVADRLHFNIMFKKAPFRLWFVAHRLFNRVLFKPSHMITTARRSDMG